MPSVQVTLTGNPNNYTEVDIPNPTGRIVATMMSSVSEAWITVDQTAPVPPSGSIITNNQKTLAGVAGAQVVLQPPLPGGHMALPVVRLASSGSPVIELEW